MNSVSITGRVAREIELRYTENGTAVTTFPLAVEDNYKGQDGKRPVNFIDVTCWKQKAEFVAAHLAKGNRAAVTGRLNQQKFTDKEGNNRSKIEVVADNVEPIDWANDKQEVAEEDVPW